MKKSMFFASAMLVGSLLLSPVAAKAADLIVAPLGVSGAHEIWAHNQMGQSFVATATTAKVGFLLNYDAVSAAMSAPNATTANLLVSLYSGESMLTVPLAQTNIIVDSNTNGYVDFDLSTVGINLVPGNTYTLGMSIDNRGWINPSVCDVNLDGAYTLGHPFFNGVITTNEFGICDNSFHVIDLIAAPIITPTPTVTPTPIVSTNKKVESKGKITQVSNDNIVVNGLTLRIVSSTVVKLNYTLALSLGQKVEFKGMLNTDGTVTLSKIEVNN